jgi:NAD(P)-dependent dehydrogenase (short-subunit alcohol dehydrogenase family)
MLLGLILGVQAVAASSAGVPAMSKSAANEYLSKGKTCVGLAPRSCQTLKLNALCKS